MIGRILESMLGIFWTAGTGTLPFLSSGWSSGTRNRRPTSPRGARVAAAVFTVSHAVSGAGAGRCRVLRVYHSGRGRTVAPTRPRAAPPRRRRRPGQPASVERGRASPSSLASEPDEVVVEATHAGPPPVPVRLRPPADLAGAALGPLRRHRPARGAGQPGRRRGVDAWPGSPASALRSACTRAQNIDKRYPPPFRWIERATAASGRRRPHVQRRGRAHPAPQGLQRRDRAISDSGSTWNGSPPARPDAGPDPADRRALRVGYVGRLEPHKGVEVPDRGGRGHRGRRRSTSSATARNETGSSQVVEPVGCRRARPHPGLRPTWTTCRRSTGSSTWWSCRRSTPRRGSSSSAGSRSRPWRPVWPSSPRAAAPCPRSSGTPPCSWPPATWTSWPGPGQAARRPGLARRAGRRRARPRRERSRGRRWRRARSTSIASCEWSDA